MDLLCEEVSNFSYYYQNYRIYVLNFLYDLLDNDLTAASKKDNFEKIQRIIDFPTIDELMSQYVILERCYIQNAFVKGVMNDNQEFININKDLIKNQGSESEGGKEVDKSKLKTGGAQDSKMGDGQSILDLIDNFCFILDKCCKRALMSLSIANTCSIFNFINELLQEQILLLFEVRFCIFSGLIQKPEYALKYQAETQGQNKLHRITNLFEITDKCGFYKT